MIFALIKKENKNNNFKEFLNYFENEYINKYGVESWNYAENVRHVTNNACESYNSKLNRLFSVKPTFYKLLYELRLEEHQISVTYNKRKNGLLGLEFRRRLKTEKKLFILSNDIKLIEEMPDATHVDIKNKAIAWLDSLKKLGKGLLEN